MTTSALNSQLVERRTEALRLRDLYDHPAAPAPEIPQPVEVGADPWGTMPMPVVPHEGDEDNKVSPGTWAQIEQQRAAGNHTPDTRPSSPVAGASAMAAIFFAMFVETWMFMGEPDVLRRWPTLVAFGGMAAVAYLPVLGLLRYRNQRKDQHR